MNHTKPIEYNSLQEDDNVTYMKTCSNKYQSKVNNFWYNSIVNKNRFKEEIRDIQKKYNIELMKE